TFSILRQAGSHPLYLRMGNVELKMENHLTFFQDALSITSLSLLRSQKPKWRKIHVASRCHGDAAASPAYPVDFEFMGAAVHSCGWGAADSRSSRRRPARERGIGASRWSASRSASSPDASAGSA